MFSVNNFSFTNEQFDILNSIFDKDFEGIWTLREDGGLDIDVFVLHQVTNTGQCIVLENGDFRMSGYLTDCLVYIHHWL